MDGCEGQITINRIWEIFADAWDKDEDKLLKCPQCNHRMIIIQVEPLLDDDNALCTI